MDRPGDGQRLALAARHGADRLLRVGDVDADLDHLVMGDAVHFLHAQQAVRARAGVELAPHEEVARDAHQRVEREILVDRADPRRAGIARRAEVDRLLVDIDLALGRLVHAREDADQRRLAGAVVAEQRVHLAAIDLEIDAVQGGERAEALDELLDADDGRGHGQSPPVMRLRTLSLRKTAISSTTPTKTR